MIIPNFHHQNCRGPRAMAVTYVIGVRNEGLGFLGPASSSKSLWTV